MSKLCSQCEATGLPILPVRYAIVPSGITPALPAWASGKRVKDVNVGPDYHYALRTLRSGFLYLFYDKHPQLGKNQWECYSVMRNGCLSKQADAKSALQPNDTMACVRDKKHSPALVHYLVVEQPEKCGTVWLAYSEHKWSDDTLKRYADDFALRDLRMQTIKMPALATTGNHSHATPVSAAALEAIIEYAPAFSESSLPFDGKLKTLSQEDGSYDSADLKKQSTRYPWHLRQGMGEETAKSMLTRAKRKDGGANVPVVFAIWDAIGITHELNGFRNEAAGRIDQYGRERELQLTALNAIDGLKVALAERAGDSQKKFQDEMKKNSSYASELAEIQKSRASAATFEEPRRSQALEVCDIREDWARRDVPKTLTYGIRLNQANLSPEPRRSQEISAIKKDVDAFLASREKNYHKNIADAKANAWPKYDEKLDHDRLNNFRKNHSEFLTTADLLIDARTITLITWLEASLFVDTLEDCSATNINDGIEFEDKISNAIFGIGSTKSGAEKLTTWIKEAKASVKTNLVWRALALNQESAIADLNSALKAAQEAQSARTVATVLNVENIIAKSLKAFSDTHKKAAGVLSANTTASSTAGSKAFGATLKPINTRDLDKLATTVGDAVVRHFKIDGLADHLSEKIIQHMFSVRALVDTNDSLALIVAQAANEPESRGQLLRRLRSASTFLAADSPEIKTAQAENLKAAWGKFKQTSDKAPQAMKDARLAIVVMLIEGLNFQKLLGDCVTKNDAKSWWSLAASGMTITSGLFDVASVPAKNLFGAESWSYQKMKLYGGVLSVGATAVGVWFDVSATEKSRDRQQYLLATLYGLKALLGVASIGLTAATSFTYAAPLIGRLTGRAVYAGAARAVGARAAAIIATRILFMSAGAWITVGAFTIQVFIWAYTDDDLQSWCERCGLGKKRDTSWTASKQTSELTEALKAVGV